MKNKLLGKKPKRVDKYKEVDLSSYNESELENNNNNEKLKFKNTKNNKAKIINKYPLSDKTVSIVIPSSIVDNAQSKELRTYLVGQISRICGIFRVDEIIIFHDKLSENKDYINFFITNLQYLETPQYLRKFLFPKSDDLSNCGLMNPLDSNHHLRIDEICQYREGIVLNRPVKDGSWVNIGLKKDCKIDKILEEKTRVTIKLNNYNDKSLKYYSGNVVSPLDAKKDGLYWGYYVRVANNIEEVFNESLFNKEKYDFIIGTSDRGKKYYEVDFNKYSGCNHCLLFFGGLQGIEALVDNDEGSKITSENIYKMFDEYINTCPFQGCRTIRTEEAIMISLSVIQDKMLREF